MRDVLTADVKDASGDVTETPVVFGDNGDAIIGSGSVRLLNAVGDDLKLSFSPANALLAALKL